jgi:putative membrane protein
MPDLTRSIVHLLVTAASVFVVAKVLPGMKVKSFGAAVAFAFVVALLNVFAWTFLAPFTLPFKYLTLGIGGFVINGIVFVVAGRIVGGVKISGCFMAAIASAVVTFVSHVIHHLLHGVSL